METGLYISDPYNLVGLNMDNLLPTCMYMLMYLLNSCT